MKLFKSIMWHVDYIFKTISMFYIGSIVLLIVFNYLLLIIPDNAFMLNLYVVLCIYLLVKWVYHSIINIFNKVGQT